MIRSRLSRRVLAAFVMGGLLVPLVGRAAEHRGGHDPQFRAHEYREREFHDRNYLDDRYHHDHYYPPIGYRFGRLPPGYHNVMFRGVHYFFADALWYAFDGVGYAVVAPPFGVMVPVLPPYYTTVWLGGVPYYYANSVYYAQSPQGYVVVPAPAGPVAATPPAPVGTPAGNAVVEEGPVPAAPPRSPSPPGTVGPTAQLFIYPRQGQSTEVQAKDRNECHAWATNQLGTDPTLPGDGRLADRLGDYQRAMDACLDARGYTVR